MSFEFVVQKCTCFQLIKMDRSSCGMDYCALPLFRQNAFPDCCFNIPVAFYHAVDIAVVRFI